MMIRWLHHLRHLLFHTLAGRFLILLSLPLLVLVVTLRQPDYQPPIFDAQVHYNQDSWQRVSVKAVLNTARELNVPWMVVGSTPNEGTWRLYTEDPQRVLPMFIPYHTREDRETWFNDQDILRYLEIEISRHRYRGIGEFYLFDGQVNTPVVRRMIELARENHLILHARSDPNAIEELFSFEPSLQILWAHAGMFTQPDTIDNLLFRHPTLWVEISHRGDVAPEGTLAPQWRALILRYPDRFLLGSGTYNEEYWYQFRYILSDYRAWLRELPPDIAERIAYRNGLSLFGLREKTP